MELLYNIDWKYVFAAILLIDAVMAYYIALRILWTKGGMYIENVFLCICSFFSGVWSTGFGLLVLQTSERSAYWCRTIGIIGTFGYLIISQVLISYIADIEKKWKMLFNGISSLGIIIYFFSVQPDQTTYVMTDLGMSYQFKQGVVNNIYTAYFILVAFNIFLVILYMIRRSKLKRMRFFGWRFFILEIMVMLGSVLDMVFPAFGLPALPGSNVTQFWGLIAILTTIRVIGRSKINLENMSTYIYYSIASPVLVYDQEAQLRIANDAAASFLKIDRDLIGEEEFSVYDLFQVRKSDFVKYRQGESDHVEVDAICLVNHIYCNLQVSRITDDYGDAIGSVVMIMDLSERMRQINNLEIAKQEAETAKRLADIARGEADEANLAKSKFLANMSHEIRTPMNAVQGFAQLILQEEISEQVRDYVSDIKLASDNLLGIINDILNISKIEAGKMELICENYNPAKLFYSIESMTRQQAEKKGLALEVQVDPTIASELNGDATRVREIIINILSNAVKYTKHGKIRLEVENTDVSEGKMLLTMRISDTGVGIKEAELPGLFDTFIRADIQKNRSIEGTGLGLSIVKGLVELMGGSISVESVYGEGSTFTVLLEQEIVDATPIGDYAKNAMAEMKVQTIGELKFGGSRVLVVDDNPINRKVISKTLEKYAMAVDVVDSGFAAIEACKQTEYHIVFMDQMMPEMDGTEAMLQIRKEIPYYAPDAESKIVALTANAIKGVKEELLQIGFDDYLEKPMNMKEVERVLQSYLVYQDAGDAVGSVHILDGAHSEKKQEVVSQKEVQENFDEVLSRMHNAAQAEDMIGLMQSFQQLSEMKPSKKQQIYVKLLEEPVSEMNYEKVLKVTKIN